VLVIWYTVFAEKPPLTGVMEVTVIPNSVSSRSDSVSIFQLYTFQQLVSSEMEKRMPPEHLPM